MVVGFVDLLMKEESTTKKIVIFGLLVVPGTYSVWRVSVICVE